MRKGIVMEKYRRYVIVLCPGGCFQKMPPVQDVDIGEEIEFIPIGNEKSIYVMFRKNNFLRIPVKILAIATLFMLIALPFYLMPNKSDQTYAYVNLDINPSMELHVDKKLNVQSITALNKDAKELLRNADDLKGRSLNDAVKEIMERSEKEDLTQNGKRVLVGVSYAEGVKKEVFIVKHLDHGYLEKQNEWNFAVYKIPNSIWKQAEKENISVNKLIAKELNKKDSNILRQLSKSETFSTEDRALIHSFYYPSKSKENKRKEPKREKETERDQIEKESKNKKNTIDELLNKEIQKNLLRTK